MNPVPEIAPLLKRLRLSGILESLETRNRQAIDKKLPYTDFLALLIQDEVVRRDQKKINLRLRRAGFQSNRTLESFDFDCNPGVHRELLVELALDLLLVDLKSGQILSRRRRGCGSCAEPGGGRRLITARRTRHPLRQLLYR